MEIDVSIIIANWNGENILQDCINSIYGKALAIKYEIIVVDDCSSDQSIELINKLYPEVILIVNENNLGFAKTNNVGVKYAQGKYIFLLNNDTILRNNVLKIFFDFMESNPTVAVCGGTLLNTYGTRQISYGNFPSMTEAIHGTLMLYKLFPNSGWVKQKGIIPDHTSNNIIEVDYVSGAAFFIRKSIVDKLGLFDESFEAYCEETDLCYRLKKSDQWSVKYIPEAEITHLYSYSYDSIKEKRLRTQLISYDIYLNKYYGKLYVIIVRFLYALQHIFSLMFRITRLLGNNNASHKNKIREDLFCLKYYIFSKL
jgi:GT2 family glycosyltransferase